MLAEPATPTSPISYLNLSYAALYEKVSQAAASLQNLGVVPLDRVSFYGPNCIEAVVACLATISIGAIWSSAAAILALMVSLTDLHRYARGLVSRFDTIHNLALVDSTQGPY